MIDDAHIEVEAKAIRVVDQKYMQDSGSDGWADPFNWDELPSDIRDGYRNLARYVLTRLEQQRNEISNVETFSPTPRDQNQI